jgi:lysozyme family protein
MVKFGFEMSQATFERALSFVLLMEGGYSDRKSDLGGATNRGITQATYNRYRADLGLPQQPVKLMTEAETEDCYLRYYWQPCHGQDFAYPLAAVMFDSWVQFSPVTVSMFCLRVLGESFNFNSSIWAQLQNSNQLKVAEAIITERMNFRYQRVKEDPSQAVNLVGWLNRDHKLLLEISKVEK